MTTKSVSKKLVLVNRCARCVALRDLYDKTETIQRNIITIRNNPMTAHMFELSEDDMIDVKDNYIEKINHIENNPCRCEFQVMLSFPYSNTGVKNQGGY